jgi:hypothetical protein
MLYQMWIVLLYQVNKAGAGRGDLDTCPHFTQQSGTGG